MRTKKKKYSKFKKFKKLLPLTGKGFLACLISVLLVASQVDMLSAFEAGVVNVTAQLKDRCEAGYSISGVKFNDRDKDGVQDSGEEGLSGWIIVLNKGAYEPQYDFDNSGFISITDKEILRNIVENGLECPVGKDCDFDDDGDADNDDVLQFLNYINDRDLGNRSTAADGTYSFIGLTEGAYVVYEAMQSNWTNSTPFIQYIDDILCGDNRVDFGNFMGEPEPFCGDGILQTERGEQCDDGNTADGDGCSALCTIERGQCDALSIGYWQNHEGCPAESIWQDEVNALSAGTFFGAFASTTGAQICETLAPGSCPAGGTVAGQLCRAKGKALANFLNLVSGRLQLDAILSGADDGNAAFDNLGLTPLSTVEEAITIIEQVILDSNHTRDILRDAAYVGERIYAFYEDENPARPECVFSGCGNAIVEAGEQCDDGNLVASDGCSAQCALEKTEMCAVKFNDTDQDGIRDNTEPMISGWNMQLKKPILCAEDEEFADEVVLFVQGARKDGSAVLLENSNTLSVLGAPENTNASGTFYSLGFGDASSTAVMVLKFNNLVFNGDGPDLEIFEASEEPYPSENADVYLSQDGENWHFAGNFDKDAVVDISTASSDLLWIQYVKIIDATDPNLHIDDADGYDIDGLRAINCVSGWEVLESKLTDNNGRACFENLSSGIYRLEEEKRVGWAASTDIFQDVELDEWESVEVLFGNFEIQQEQGGIGAISVTLNEYVPNPVGRDSQDGLLGEWVELYNNSDSSVDVNGWKIRDEAGNEVVVSAVNTHTSSTIIGAQGTGSEWLVVFLNRAMLNNNGDTVYLYNSSDTILDSHTYGNSVDSDLDDDPDDTPGGGNERGDDRSGQEGKANARIPDGTGTWFDPVPTPGGPNKMEESEPLEEPETNTSIQADILEDIQDETIDESESDENVVENITPENTSSGDPSNDSGDEFAREEGSSEEEQQNGEDINADTDIEKDKAKDVDEEVSTTGDEEPQKE